jgi:hypothetical protein
MTEQSNAGQRIFGHFNRAWTPDPTIKRWSLSVKANMQVQARAAVNNLRELLTEQYGTEVTKFFVEPQNEGTYSWKSATMRNKTNHTNDDDDDWFEEEDDIDELVTKGLVDGSFLQFLTEGMDDNDKHSVASWGTGDTAYTEIITTHETGTAVNSSITYDSPKLTNEEVFKRTQMVKERLYTQGLREPEVATILSKQTPYELTLSGINLQGWDVDKEVFIIMAIRNQITTNTVIQNDKPKNNSE